MASPQQTVVGDFANGAGERSAPLAKFSYRPLYHSINEYSLLGRPISEYSLFTGLAIGAEQLLRSTRCRPFAMLPRNYFFPVTVGCYRPTYMALWSMFYLIWGSPLTIS